MGTKIGSDTHLIDEYVKSGEMIEVIMNPENNKKIFVLTKSGRVYNELDEYMGNYKKEGYEEFFDYLESNSMNEALGLLGKRKYDIPKKKSIGNITGRKITDYASAKRYTMGTRISADDIMRYIDKGHDIYVYINGDKRVYLDRTSGDAYSEKDEHILNVKKGGSFGSQFGRLEDYLES
jgi:hypothetical protein